MFFSALATNHLCQAAVNVQLPPYTPTALRTLRSRLVNNLHATIQAAFLLAAYLGFAAVESVAANEWTIGNKQLLVLRVDFSDLPGDPRWPDDRSGIIFTSSYVKTFFDQQIAPLYSRSSYGRTSITTTVSARVYRLPSSAASYAANWGAGLDALRRDSVAAAASDYSPANFDRVVILFSSLARLPNSQFSAPGVAQLGGQFIWINGVLDFRVMSHELAHSFGLKHANFFQVFDGNPVSLTGSDQKHDGENAADRYEIVGGNLASDTRVDFNPWYKHVLGWITDDQVRLVTTSGRYRLYRYDGGVPNGTMALKIEKDATRAYWFGVRRKFSDNPSMHHGVYAIMANTTTNMSCLLDMTTPGNSQHDAALEIGATFVDHELNLAVTALSEGSTEPNEWVDLQVTFGPPKITGGPQSRMVGLGENVAFALNAAGTGLVYQWSKDGQPIPGATRSSYELTGVRAVDAGAYGVSLTDSTGGTTSARALLVVGPGPSRTWDLATDWSDSANPNGAWSFAFDAAPLKSTTRRSDPWSRNQASWGDLPGVFRSNGTEQFIHDWRTGDVVFHSGDGALSIRWRSPVLGRIRLSGGIWAGRDIFARINQWRIFLNNTQLAAGEVRQNDPYGRAIPADFSGDAAARERLQNIFVSPGDLIELQITPNYTSGDYAGVNLMLVAEPSLSGDIAPSILTQPTDQAADLGSSVTFSAVTSGTTPLTYQWRKDGVAIPGATGTTLTINKAQPSDAGSYAVVVTNAAGQATSLAATLTVTFSRLANLSILTSLTTPGDAFTMGYVVGGSGTIGTKPLVIRAAGPSLGALGVPDTHNDPRLELFAGATKVSENDNWGGSVTTANAMSAVGAFAYIGPSSRDAAVALSVASGDNSIKVSGEGNGTGSVIAEIYDATPAANFTFSTPRLVNVSVLKQLGTGLTAGFVIGGGGTKNVLVRAVGPTLGSAFGVGGAVSDPQLTLNSGQTVLASNDNWGGGATLASVFSSVGAFALPATSRDAAVVARLSPGNYTVQVSGVAGATGMILVEIYELP